jgi:Omp85 superfamily domain
VTRSIGSAALLCGALAASAAAQETRTVAAGERYAAGGLHEAFLGENYRPEWVTPVRVEVLDPERFAGGLTVLQEGGGLSTESLRLKGADGREYVFRSVDKDVSRSVPEDLQGTWSEDIVQDLVSAKHPAAALIVPPLLEAAGVLHVVPRLYVMPDHPFLGENRAQFAGRLGQLEERPTDPDDGPGFARAEDVEGSEDLREKIEEDPEHRVDARAFLTARLMDVLLGDWDRHWDQWRWARYDQGDLKWWRPIPRDRDNAFSRHEGLIPAIGRQVMPMMVRFGPRYQSVFGLVVHASELDRLLLSSLDRAAWDSTAATLRARLTDDVIAAAVRRLPPEHYALRGAEMAADLRSRRDRLPEAAAAYYDLVSDEVDVHTTDEEETAEVVRNADGSVDVVITSTDEGRALPYYRRRFLPAETREVRLYLHGGDDRAVVRGEGPGEILVRLIGGGGDDELADATPGRGGRRTVFHDDRGDNRFTPGRGAKVDTREYRVEERDSALIGNAPPPRDWGSSFSWLTPWGGFQSNVGPVLGFGPAWTRWGFRRQPYAMMTHLRALWAPMEMGFGAELWMDRRHTNRPSRTWLRARASNFANVRFHGLGNDTPEEPTGDRYKIEQVQVRAQASYEARPTDQLTWYAGPVVAWTDTDAGEIPDPGVRGSEAFKQYGAEAGGEWDGRDSDLYPRRGAFVEARASGFGSGVGTFGRLHGEGRGYASLPGSFGPTLALRAGAMHALGDFPFQEAAYVGGAGNLRGYPGQRFTGETAVYGSAELRARLGRLHLGFVRGDFGLYALGDAGRVYVDGDSPGGWHSAAGGGVWFTALQKAVSVSYARGEEGGRIYLHFGMPF